jgi:hypothetical protein
MASALGRGHWRRKCSIENREMLRRMIKRLAALSLLNEKTEE